jgi:iron complex transport system ATP-binding protein
MPLEIKGLSFFYKAGDRPVLKDISLSFPEQGLVSILGPNGSGKTTLLKCLAKILVPREGEILYRGENLLSLKRKLLSEIFSYVPQDFALSFDLPAKEHVLLGRIPRMGWNVTKKDREAVMESMSLLGIEDLAEKNVSELSGGQRQLVSLARAVAQDARIILLDEPLSALDLGRAIEVMRLFRRISYEKDVLVICVTHTLEMAARYSDALIILHGGALFKTGAPMETLDSSMLLEVYGVEAEVRFDPKGVFLAWSD